MKDVAYLIQGIAKTIQVQDLPISGLFDEDGLSTAMLVAAGDIVVEGELCWRSHSLSLSRLSYSNVLPFAFSLIF